MAPPAKSTRDAAAPAEHVLETFTSREDAVQALLDLLQGLGAGLRTVAPEADYRNPFVWAKRAIRLAKSATGLRRNSPSVAR